MTQDIKELSNLDHKKDLEDFAKYLGVDYEDLYEMNYKNQYEDIDFDDWSR